MKLVSSNFTDLLVWNLIYFCSHRESCSQNSDSKTMTVLRNIERQPLCISQWENPLTCLSLDCSKYTTNTGVTLWDIPLQRHNSPLMKLKWNFNSLHFGSASKLHTFINWSTKHDWYFLKRSMNYFLINQIKYKIWDPWFTPILGKARGGPPRMHTWHWNNTMMVGLCTSACMLP